MENNDILPEQLFCTAKDKILSSKIMKQKAVAWAGKELSRRRYEKFLRLSYAADCVTISEDNLPEIYRTVQDLCDSLSLKIPDIYLLNSAQPKAFVAGEVSPLLLISSAAVTLFSTEQLRVIIAQALMHLHCGHMRCFMLKDLLTSTADNVGIFKSVVALPRMLLEEWYIEAQISADRGALYLLNDLDLILDTYALMITGGVGKQGGQVLLDEYENYLSTLEDTPLCPLFKTWSDLYHANERYVFRAGMLKEYKESDEFADIQAGIFNAKTVDEDIDEDITEEDACAYWDGMSGRGGVWEAEDVHEKLAFGFTDLQGTTDFIKMYAGDVFKFGVDSASKVTSSVLSGIGNILTGQDKKD